MRVLIGVALASASGCVTSNNLSGDSATVGAATTGTSQTDSDVSTGQPTDSGDFDPAAPRIVNLGCGFSGDDVTTFSLLVESPLPVAVVEAWVFVSCATCDPAGETHPLANEDQDSGPRGRDSFDTYSVDLAFDQDEPWVSGESTAFWCEGIDPAMLEAAGSTIGWYVSFDDGVTECVVYGSLADDPVIAGGCETTW